MRMKAKWDIEIIFQSPHLWWKPQECEKHSLGSHRFRTESVSLPLLMGFPLPASASQTVWSRCPSSGVPGAIWSCGMREGSGTLHPRRKETVSLSVCLLSQLSQYEVLSAVSFSDRSPGIKMQLTWFTSYAQIKT